jgi:hypothetical protein
MPLDFDCFVLDGTILTKEEYIKQMKEKGFHFEGDNSEVKNDS